MQTVRFTYLCFACLGFALPASIPVFAEGVPGRNSADPFMWMEEIEGSRALAWAREENARSLKVLQQDARYPGLLADARHVLNGEDRIPSVSFAGTGELRNLWQNPDHVRGVWRRTTLEGYRSKVPEWETLLDIDALAAIEKTNWVWQGAACLPPADRRCLILLSNGGKDANDIREFDVDRKSFVPDGFVAPEGKQYAAWIDADTLLLARDWGAGTMTKSGYPFIIKRWRRGQPLEQTSEAFRGSASDVMVYPLILTDSEGRVQATIAARQVSKFEAEYYLLTDEDPIKLPLPPKSTVHGLVQGRVVFTLEQDWPAQNLKVGDLAAYDLAAMKSDAASTAPQLIHRLGDREAIERVRISGDKLFVPLYENVVGSIWVFEPKGVEWQRTRLDLPAHSSVFIDAADRGEDRIIASTSNYLTPTTQWLVSGASHRTEKLKALPPQFDASGHVVEQFQVTSTDGTRIPYFVVRPKNAKLDGTAPTLMFAYGGFQWSLMPAYTAHVGKLWLERGGTYVVANIRGGGEFGPAWHNAGLKANRQKVFDDFFAVSEDIIARKVTSPRRLGIMGSSNGGLLMGVALTQRPELYNAIVIAVPLLDMLRYTHLGAGASWVGEYGDPAVPEERATLERYSPYQNLRAGRKYPQVFIETSTKDDRVHPAHARKAAARLKELGYQYLYFENIDGGHAAAANLNERARRYALEFTYLSRRLMDQAATRERCEVGQPLPSRP